MMIVEFFHNIRWPKYKAAIFSQVYLHSKAAGIDVRFCHIADTSNRRSGLTDVNVECHKYPHEVLFNGSYDEVPTFSLFRTLFLKVFFSNADLIVLPGYDRIEHWGMLAAAILRRKARAVFCDSTLLDRRQSLAKGLPKRLFFNLCNGYFAYGTRSAELLCHYGADPAYVYYPCQAAALPDDYSEAVAKRRRFRLAPSVDRPRFLFVGRFAAEKSLEVLLHAFAKVLKDLPGAQLVLVGAGPLCDMLRQLVDSLGIRGAVTFAGSMDADQVARQYARATCLVLPSRSEPWGLVVNEALHHGCPVVISSNCGCIPELVKQDLTGFVFRTGDVEDLAEKLLLITLRFNDHSAVADRSLELISTYTPSAAASNMIKGCLEILAGSRV